MTLMPRIRALRNSYSADISPHRSEERKFSPIRISPVNDNRGMEEIRGCSRSLAQAE